MVPAAFPSSPSLPFLRPRPPHQRRHRRRASAPIIASVRPGPPAQEPTIRRIRNKPHGQSKQENLRLKKYLSLAFCSSGKCEVRDRTILLLFLWIDTGPHPLALVVYTPPVASPQILTCRISMLSSVSGFWFLAPRLQRWVENPASKKKRSSGNLYLKPPHSSHETVLVRPPVHP